jgi:hypothetical protein
MKLSLCSVRQKKTRALYHVRSLSYLARKVPTFKKKRLYLWRFCISISKYLIKPKDFMSSTMADNSNALESYLLVSLTNKHLLTLLAELVETGPIRLQISDRDQLIELR